MKELESVVDPTPTPAGYTIRIVAPADAVSTLEVRTYPTVDEAREAMGTVSDKLTRNGVREYEIHMIEQVTGTVVRTWRRELGEGRDVYSNPTER